MLPGARPRADQRQPLGGHDLRDARQRRVAAGHRRRLPPLPAPAGRLQRRDRHRPLPDDLAPGGARRHRGHAAHDRRRPAPDLLHAAAGVALPAGAGRAGPRLVFQRASSTPRARRSPRRRWSSSRSASPSTGPACRDPGLLQPAAALAAHGGRRPRGRAERDPRRDLLRAARHRGIPLATSLASIVTLLVLLYLLEREMGGLHLDRVLDGAARSLVASGISVLLAWSAWTVLDAGRRARSRRSSASGAPSRRHRGLPRGRAGLRDARIDGAFAPPAAATTTS